ncbi:MAG: hypothetical protein NTW61_04410 [Candidatus Melainabacteria bacterium]|nr:hypothetical protein [Candidatus Melainabacteria bacterium]
MPSLLMPSVTPTFTVPKFQKTDTFQQEKPAIGGYFKTPTLNQDVFQPTATPPASSQVRSGLTSKSIQSIMMELSKWDIEFSNSNRQMRSTILTNIENLVDELEAAVDKVVAKKEALKKVVVNNVEDPDLGIGTVAYYREWLAEHTTTQQ